MDWVPRHLRGRVNAVDSVRSFSWSGSAALGGFLIQRYGFQRTFLITAAIKAAAFAPLIVLLAYVPDGICLPTGARVARLRQQQRARQGAAAGVSEQAADGQQPAVQPQAAVRPAAVRPAALRPQQLGSMQKQDEAQQPLLPRKPER